MNLRHRLVVMVFLHGFFGGVGVAAGQTEPISLAIGTGPIPLGRHIEVLRDEAGALSFDEIRSPAVAAGFSLPGTDSFSYGLVTRAVYWYRVSLSNPADQSQPNSYWVLQQLYPWLDYADIYISRQDGSTERIQTGGRRQPYTTQLSDRSIAIPLHVEPGETVTLHLRVLSETGHQVSLAAWTSQGFHAAATREHLWFGLFYGILLVMIVYNLFIYLWVRDTAYLYYVLYIASIAAWAFIYSGHARQYVNTLFTSAPDWVHASYPMALGLSVLFANLFARELLQTRRHSPRLHVLFGVIALLALSGIASYPVIPYEISLGVGVLLSIVTALLALLAGVYLVLKGLRVARFYLMAWGAFLAAVVAAVLVQYDLVPLNAFTTYAWHIGACIEVTILSLALADRINTERAEKFAARSETLAAHERALADAERVGRLKSFLPQRVAELVAAGGDRTLLEPQRRRVTVCVIDLRGFTPFSESVEPEDVMAVLREFYTTMGNIVERHGGTVEHFAGDSMLIFFNAPLEMSAPEEHAVRAALEMREAYASLRAQWARHGHELGLGIGIAAGFATVGAIGFSGRSQYSAIGTVTNLAARLCSVAAHDEILTTSRMQAVIESFAELELIGEQSIRGFKRPIEVVRVLGLKPLAGL